jgi:hypothetical protein
MINRFILLVILTGLFGCQEGSRSHQPETGVLTDSSLIKAADSSSVAIMDSTTAKAIVIADSLIFSADKLIGKWIQPVPGVDKEMQGFYLKKDGTARSINMYTLVYEKWTLQHDTLLLWNHSEGVADTTTIIDTALIKELTDSTLVLFPVNAAEGYREKYTRPPGKKGSR